MRGWVFVLILVIEVAQMFSLQSFDLYSTYFPPRAILQNLCLIGFLAEFTILDFSNYGLG
ncbi:hypothetical protein NIES2119_15365 [[Phormidium ambiguum] IAM M-71]|uniref:Uncharacterized protein n=1 Tax=[Phormidium ambiguum] IAM M-71 TaxID=454136 RepID=A0A1U7II92_9CYAN|nr:hypothetical protein NIES2119_15365 [Phormidium ambiguum IAM M-71]